MPLTGSQFQQLQQALLSAFPDHASLAQMVRVGLNENLEIIAEGNLKKAVFGLITWADAYGKVEDLVTAAHEANPNFAWVKPDAQELRAKTLWNMPHERNAFFAGRTAELETLRDALASHKSAALIQAIRGLGGIGKTQCAVEYAFRCREGEAGYPTYDYILWIKSESVTDLLTGYSQIAAILPLSLSNPDDQQQVALAVKRWLETNPNWLLIFDNADDPDLLEPYRPKNASGHILLTSRANHFKGNLGIKHPVELRSLLPEDAIAFLFHRTDRNIEHEPALERNAAADLAEQLGYFPLALEQAAAYITAEERSFAAYLADFRKREIELLNEAPPETGEYHGVDAQEYKTVRTTWDFNFKAIEKDNPATAELLRFCAFLAPDDIPMHLVITAARTLGSPLADVFTNLQEDADYIRAYDELLKPLLRYSLIEKKRNVHTFNMHRMVQAVQRDRLGPDQRAWVERSGLSLCKAFPNAKYGNWDSCAVLLSHAQFCLQQALKWRLELQEIALLSIRAGFYLHTRGSYSETEPLFKQALEVYQVVLPTGHPDIGTSLNNLAGLYESQGRYEEAEPLYKQALELSQAALPAGHPNIAGSLNNLADLYESQGRYEEAEPLFKQALEVYQAALPAGHPDIGTSLNNLAGLYNSQGRYEEAEPLYKQALEVYQAALPAGHPDIGTSLNNLAGLYNRQGRYEEAEPLYKQAVKIMLKTLGMQHPNTQVVLKNYLIFLLRQGNREAAEAFAQSIGVAFRT